jgi:hypothetical protein
MGIFLSENTTLLCALSMAKVQNNNICVNLQRCKYNIAHKNIYTENDVSNVTNTNLAISFAKTCKIRFGCHLLCKSYSNRYIWSLIEYLYSRYKEDKLRIVLHKTIYYSTS